MIKQMEAGEVRGKGVLPPPPVGKTVGHGLIKGGGRVGQENVEAKVENEVE